MYILNIIRSIYAVLSREQKLRMLLMQFFFLFSAAVQVVGIASIAPFIGIISNPESIQTNRALAALYEYGGFQSNQEFITGFALLSIAMIFISNFVSALTIWLQFKFSIYLGSNLQCQLFEKSIRRDYLFHKTTNYNKLISTISADAPRFIYMVLQPYLLMCSQLFIALIILVGLLFLDPVVAVGSALVVGGAYLCTYWLIKTSLRAHGDIITKRNKVVQSIMSESFIGIKDIKLNALEAKYTQQYLAANKQGLDSSAYIALSGDLPRFAIETVSFSAILLFAVWLLSGSNESTNVVSLLSVYALAGYKLLPTMQQIYKSVSSMSANGGVAIFLRKQLDFDTPNDEKTDVPAIADVTEIELKNISYHYPKANKPALDDVTVKFTKGQLNTIAGPSGSGKSTLADIILGLLPPASGQLFTNHKPTAGKDLIAYQRTIGYVPQHIFILDGDVITNVAFGVNREDVDIARVKTALQQANAMEFVEKLPKGLENDLGQDGKLLSGGQRQRIGIARALYRNNKILVLDEPTSALDIDSEHELMQLLNELKHDRLIIVISHRPAAIKLSDKITVIADGKLIANDSYSALYESDSYFRNMIEKGSINTGSQNE
ncbi:ABC transporter ATP-binding protein [Cellvibrio fibrivorans]|jgi:ABC-type multidrug transport system fused ATPase/permease subunit|uniref:ABC-type multidrug transport system fused ATPase/permease subunit n=1 Tax=Cellvibrio fibrivorans TaxID=126350 RepID=A0ABU1UTY6_9GAMM|nr:ABC transporter ATP-binding protein [Cellvibrio fibrivorans]MDR7088653.1 ABC-type multidrug transport system fused ATPase/permease subunit [Cellvibrio fibrivorans]